MIWKTPCPAEEGGAYPGCLGVKAGLHSEAYWLRLGPVWTIKLPSDLTSPRLLKPARGLFFFFCIFLWATTSTSATEAQTSCALLCICVSDLSGFRRLAGDGDTEKKIFLVQNLSPSFPRHLASLLLVSANICLGPTVPGWPWRSAPQHRLKTKGWLWKKGS